MKLLPSLVFAAVLFAVATDAFAATTPPPAQSSTPTPVVAPPEPVPPGSHLKFDDYINDLASALKLSDDEKKAIVSFYQADGAQLKAILDNDSISPLEQDRRICDLRDARNAKIESLLGSSDRTATFLKIEAKYRVALIDLAGDGGLMPLTAPPAQAPAASASPPAPSQ
jgi:hypothetical protein